MNFYVFDPGVHHVFPQKGDVAADAQLRPALPRALDDTMVATFTSVTKAPRELTCELSGVIQKISPRDVAPKDHAVHGRRRKKKSQHYRPTSCPSAIDVTIVRTTTAAYKDPANARLTETGPKSVKVVFSRLHNHSCVDLDLRRHVEPQVLDWLHARFAAGVCSARYITAKHPHSPEHVGPHVT